MPGSARGWKRWGPPLGVILAMIIGVLAAPPATAAPAAPSNLSPNGTTVSANPVLSWSGVRAATSYDVEVSATSDFGDPLYTVTTTNRRATPTSQLPISKIWWRVRTRTSSATSAWATASFTRTKLAGPQPTSPADGTALKQPGQPPLLKWSPVTGATSYSIEVDRGLEPDWVDAQSYTTQTTSLVVPNPQENGQYWWRVRAEIGSGQSTHPSPEWSYSVGGLPVVENVTPLHGTPVEEVVLEWDPVPGAVTYDIRVSADDSFNEIIDERVVTGTRYSPPKTYDVDDYWWQVRARNIFGKAKEWTEVQEKHQFRRKWEGVGVKPELLHPADTVSAFVGDNFYYQWTPSRLASRYRLDVGTDPNFSEGTFESCFTTQTTYTPGFGRHPRSSDYDKCLPGNLVTHYWRVKALDSWKGETTSSTPGKSEIQGVYSDIHKFTYSPGSVVPISPLDGDTVDIPTLRWKPALDAVKYEVELTWYDGSRSRSMSTTTFATSWTPTGGSQLDPAEGPFTWTVRAVDHNGKSSPLPVFGAGETFDVSGSIPTTGQTPLTPLTTDPSAPDTARVPELRWEPAPGAAYYKLAIGTAGSGGVTLLDTKFPYPAATETSDQFLTAGAYDWIVAAFDETGAEMPVTPGRGTFTVGQLPLVKGNRIALDGAGLAADTACGRNLAGAPQGVCSGMRATPVLDWEPVPDAGYYMIYLSRDRNFQNMVYGSYSDQKTIPRTTNTMFSPVQALEDSQAGVAYYWYIRPCKAPGNCAPDPLQATHAFDKTSHKVELVSPVVKNAVVPEITTNAVTFDWVDYLQTNQTSGRENPITGEKPGQAARAYYIEVSTSPAFTTLIDSAVIDQTTYTAYTKMYPEGQLYWRVQAIDGSGNGLAWSDTHEFTKASPKPTPISPEGATSTTEPFRWEPAPYAKRYELEVYKNGDTAASSSNRVLSEDSLQVAYSLTRPLPGGTTYVWRVRRLDSSNNAGRWSSWTSFQVAGDAPGLRSPSSGAWLRANDALFTWTPVEGAASYLFERRAAGSTRNTETVKTASTAWAPYRSITTGKWEWRVSSLDAAGKIIRSSGWRSFSVDATAPTIVGVSPSGYSVKPGASFKIKFSEPVKNVSGSTVRLFKYGAQKKVRARVTLSSDRRVATLNPAVNLRRGTYYVIKVSGSITDRFGNPMRAYETRIRTR